MSPEAPLPKTPDELPTIVERGDWPAFDDAIDRIVLYPNALPWASGHLEDPDPSIRIAAIAICGAVRMPISDRIKNVIAGKALVDEDPLVRLQSTFAIFRRAFMMHETQTIPNDTVRSLRTASDSEDLDSLLRAKAEDYLAQYRAMQEEGGQ